MGRKFGEVGSIQGCCEQESRDGGYNLVGLKRPLRPILEKIEWGTGDVLRRSIEAAVSLEIEPALMESLPDIDDPGDLADGLAALDEGSSVSVVIPVLSEAENLKSILPLVIREHPGKILAVDGESQDDTLAVAESFGVRVIRAARGRGSQMNAGARAATGEFLLFLHADTVPRRVGRHS